DQAPRGGTGARGAIRCLRPGTGRRGPGTLRTKNVLWCRGEHLGPSDGDGDHPLARRYARKEVLDGARDADRPIAPDVERGTPGPPLVGRKEKRPRPDRAWQGGGRPKLEPEALPGVHAKVARGRPRCRPGRAGRLGLVRRNGGRLEVKAEPEE